MDEIDELVARSQDCKEVRRFHWITHNPDREQSGEPRARAKSEKRKANSQAH